MKLFNENITEEEMFDAIKKANTFNKENYENFLLRKEQNRSYMRIYKPFEIDWIRGLMRNKNFSEEMLIKHKKIIFSTYDHLSTVLLCQKVPDELIMRYMKRILKKNFLLQSFFYQVITFHMEKTSPDLQRIIFEKFKEFQEYIKNSEILIQSAQTIPGVAVLLKLKD
jgi:hypothetical protein